MVVSFDLKQLALTLLFITLIVLVIVMIVLCIKAVKTLGKVNEVLDDSKRVSKIVAERSEQLDYVVGEASDAVLSIADTVRGNSNLIDKVSNIGMGFASMKDVLSNFRTKDDEAFMDRARARKASKKVKKVYRKKA